jgi:hypothetical protein
VSVVETAQAIWVFVAGSARTMYSLNGIATTARTTGSTNGHTPTLTSSKPTGNVIRMLRRARAISVGKALQKENR